MEVEITGNPSTSCAGNCCWKGMKDLVILSCRKWLISEIMLKDAPRMTEKVNCNSSIFKDLVPSPFWLLKCSLSHEKNMLTFSEFINGNIIQFPFDVGHFGLHKVKCSVLNQPYLTVCTFLQLNYPYKKYYVIFFFSHEKTTTSRECNIFTYW